MTRERLPDRRPSITMELVHDWRTYSVTIGFDVDRDRIGEVFTHGAKVGSAMDAHPGRCVCRAIPAASAWR